MAGNLKAQAQKILEHNLVVSIPDRRKRAVAARTGSRFEPLGFQTLKGLGDGQLDKLIDIQQKAQGAAIDATTDILEHLQNKLGDLH